MSTPIQPTFLQELMICPAAAIETHDLRSLYEADHHFYLALDHAQRWRLLYGLQMVLLDYTSATFNPMDLKRLELLLPMGLRPKRISLHQLLQALDVANFAPERLDWEDELAIALTPEDLQACEAALTSPQADALLHQALDAGLAFLSTCDLECECDDATTRPRAGLLARLISTLGVARTRKA